MQTPVVVMNANSQREQGRKAQLGNVLAAKTVADIIRTTLGPRSMLKMLLDPIGGVVVTNDGNAILREIDVTHPAAKSMIELSRTQDEEVGDGTTSVVVLAGEMMHAASPFLERNYLHPTDIVAAYFRLLEDAISIAKSISIDVDLSVRSRMTSIIQSCIGTKFVSRWSDLMCQLALDAVMCVTVASDNRKDIDIKRYAKVEKIPGDALEDSRVIPGVMLNKDVTHPKMRRYIENPRILLLDSPLEYKKGESSTQVDLAADTDFQTLLQMEEDAVEQMCKEIIAFRPDVVFTEKGVSDLAQHFLWKANITAIRRVRKSDNNRIARACGATICSRTDEIQDRDIGTGCGLFKIEKIGDEYFTFVTECRNPKACTILLRGPAKDLLNEVERNLQDAMNVARNVVWEPRLVPGGGAFEMALSTGLAEKAKTIQGVMKWPYEAAASAFEVIPRTLAQNCGAQVVRVMTALRARHATPGNSTWGVNGLTGELADMNTLGIWDPYAVKVQTIRTAVEAACLLLRIDGIVSGVKKHKQGGGGAPQASPEEQDETFGDARDG
eukprot:gnl/Spiro4/5520_TR2799_c0_g1_i1.p1 gnl/Spiro4/5520_TR2799_c0_g1~~gnl/Spiro4/5520_TR2799_c0_g1_i1.p1  ORF type:complete len:554 (-),score=162.18 gnl/Spiro4/5520_TR2799_c0_g1_i1:137-1798(-)